TTRGTTGVAVPTQCSLARIAESWISMRYPRSILLYTLYQNHHYFIGDIHSAGRYF
ncbi:hypothetical protein COCVIDRAFT_113946, partial [Bipolaris victoriae FI3]